MPSSNEERLRIFATRLLTIMGEVAKGKVVDKELLNTLEQLADIFYKQSKQGKTLSEQQIDLLNDTILLVEKSMIVQDIKGQ